MINKFIAAFIFSTFAFTMSAQIDSIPSSNLITSEDAIGLLRDLRALELKKLCANRYKMYPTENIYNLLKLDTQTGRIEQVQWSLEDNKEYTVVINRQDLSWESGLNSFELYPTQNIYQFIMLDKATGRTWHVQWGMEEKKRWIVPIF